MACCRCLWFGFYTPASSYFGSSRRHLCKQRVSLCTCESFACSASWGVEQAHVKCTRFHPAARRHSTISSQLRSSRRCLKRRTCIVGMARSQSHRTSWIRAPTARLSLQREMLKQRRQSPTGPLRLLGLQQLADESCSEGCTNATGTSTALSTSHSFESVPKGGRARTEGVHQDHQSRPPSACAH